MRRLHAVVVGSLFLAVAAGAFAADIQSIHSNGQAIAERLIGKQLFLRGFWANESLKFNGRGQLQSSTDTVSFTESGIDVRSVRFSGGALIIEGQRMALEFLPDDQMRRIPAKTDQDNGAMTLEVQPDANGSYDQALSAIFANDLATLAPSLPSYWQAYAMQHFLPVTSSEPKLEKESYSQPAPATEVSENNDSDRAMHVGGSVKPPTLIHAYNPVFTDLANAQKFSGNVKLYLWFDSDGKVSHVSIARPAGLGLDEAAIAAVEQYQFQPATKNGAPVTVDLYLDVSFKTLHSLW
jgi:TonB family protein